MCSRAPHLIHSRSFRNILSSHKQRRHDLWESSIVYYLLLHNAYRFLILFLDIVIILHNIKKLNLYQLNYKSINGTGKSLDVKRLYYHAEHHATQSVNYYFVLVMQHLLLSHSLTKKVTDCSLGHFF